MEKRETFAQAIADILVKHNVVSPETGKALQKAFRDSAKEIFDNFLLEEGLVDPENLIKALAEYYQVPAFDVVGYFFERYLLHMFPKGFLLRNAIIPLEVDENIMVIIASEPNDSDLLPKIGEHVSYDIRFRVGIRRDICDAVKEFYDRALTEVKEDADLRVEHKEDAEVRRIEGEKDFTWDEEVED